MTVWKLGWGAAAASAEADAAGLAPLPLTALLPCSAPISHCATSQRRSSATTLSTMPRTMYLYD
jgi:hypothetical protein